MSQVPTMVGSEPTQSEPGDVPTMVACERVGPDDEWPQHLPTEMEAECVPKRVYIRRNVELRTYGLTQMLQSC